MSEAVDLVGTMLATYPRSDVSDSYIGAMAAVLCDYPRQIAMSCCNPLKGVVRECKFVPTIADVVAWCEPKKQELHSDYSQSNRWEKAIATAGVRRAQERAEREERERRLGPKLGSLRSDLCKRYSIRDVPPGWDAGDCCRAAHRLGARFHDEVEKLLGGPPADTAFGAVLKQAYKPPTDDDLRRLYGKRHDEPDDGPVPF